MKIQPKDEYAAFSDALKKVLSIPHSELTATLEGERRAQSAVRLRFQKALRSQALLAVTPYSMMIATTTDPLPKVEQRTRMFV